MSANYCLQAKCSKSDSFCKVVYKPPPPYCVQEDTEESAEGGLTGAVSGAEVVTVGASEGAEVATGGDTALERWTRGELKKNGTLW